MSRETFDVIIVGAGAAGLAAANDLDRAGMRVLCVEARDRIGGRIWTVHDALAPVAVELGAEFVHGRPPEIWDIIRRDSLAVQECGSFLHVENGHIQNEAVIWKAVDRVMADVQRAASESADQSFLSLLEKSAYPEDVRQWATGYVEGFNAARKELISVASLAEDAKAAEKIDGEHSFHLPNGYEAVVRHFFRNLKPEAIRLSSVVQAIDWKKNDVTVHIRSLPDSREETLRCRRAIVTVPLGVLQSEPDGNGAIRFSPEPGEILNAARALQFGQVVRLVLRFKEPFWENNRELADAGFLLSNEAVFPTWWTTLPVRSSVITGWSAGPKAAELLVLEKKELVARAVSTLERITQTQSSSLEAAYFHDWHADPLARGAYSYVPAGAMGARRKLTQPVENTLYFAGEATDCEGHSATVHGAIASGVRAARQILKGVGERE